MGGHTDNLQALSKEGFRILALVWGSKIVQSIKINNMASRMHPKERKKQLELEARYLQNGEQENNPS